MVLDAFRFFPYFTSWIYYCFIIIVHRQELQYGGGGCFTVIQYSTSFIAPACQVLYCITTVKQPQSKHNIAFQVTLTTKYKTHQVLLYAEDLQMFPSNLTNNSPCSYTHTDMLRISGYKYKKYDKQLALYQTTGSIH